MNKFFSGILIPVLIISCKNEPTGPCDYHNYEALATVKSIEPYVKNNKTLYHVGMKFNASSLSKELQYLDQLKEIEIDSAFIAKNKIKIGFKYQSLVSEIKEGNCTPLFVSIEHNFK